MAILTRRKALAGIAAIAASPGLLCPESQPIFSTPRAREIAIPGSGYTWQEVADYFAGVERRGVQYENPGTWRTMRYDGAAKWNETTLTLYGYACDARDAAADIAGHYQFFHDGETEVLAIGRSDDRYAWVMFFEARLVGELEKEPWRRVPTYEELIDRWAGRLIADVRGVKGGQP